MTDARAFVDTNVLLRSIHTGLPLHAAAAELVKRFRKDNYEMWISRQVIREYLVQVTRRSKIRIVPLA